MLRTRLSTLVIAAGLMASSIPAMAVQLDWGGQFWFDNNWLNNYQISKARPGYDNDPSAIASGSPYVPGYGEKNVVWYEAFLRLKPKVIVNDSINIKSEFHVGSPIYGFLGRNYPTTPDEKYNFTGSSRGGASITAQRFWANLITDFGTIELGRAPIHWGLGALWNSGDNLFDHYQSTGDMVRLTSKFGNFSVSPALVKVAVGNNLAGATDFSGNTIPGNDDVTDYDLAAKYDNPEEDFEFGLMWTHRAGNTAQRSILFNTNTPPNVGSTRIAYNIFDFYAKKKTGHFTFGGEVPLFSGNIGAVDGVNEYEYKTFAVVLESGYTSDMWDVDLKAGHVPGQTPIPLSGGSKFNAVYLNKDYGLGLIMFHYNIYGLNNNNPDTAASPNSPYDNPIVNANYGMISPHLKLDKWTLKAAVVAAWAEQTATAGRKFYNYNRRAFFASTGDQSSFMGKEVDLGASFKWDENFIVGWDLGFWWPGPYFAFTNNAAVDRFDLNMMFASQVKAGINF